MEFWVGLIIVLGLISAALLFVKAKERKDAEKQAGGTPEAAPEAE